MKVVQFAGISTTAEYIILQFFFFSSLTLSSIENPRFVFFSSCDYYKCLLIFLKLFNLFQKFCANPWDVKSVNRKTESNNFSIIWQVVVGFLKGQLKPDFCFLQTLAGMYRVFSMNFLSL